ncbi:helix-turn-helix domain-containing protein [Polaribacter tangerinus]|uniref:helix-turn-helix domain-containing protein n=1 Tax=Polaribacter tangerinus TaxID=1920034 RepID=UPI0011807295|nr:helix-turn-helix domain-containing protein [Polaribacter tangerinus]
MIVDIIYFTGILFMTLTAVNLCFSSKSGSKFYLRILALFFILIVLSNGFFFVVKYGLISYVPHLFKTLMPISFVIPVLGYFYIYKTIKKEDYWLRKDFLHFIPALFITINYLPFFLTGTQEKQEIINAVTSNLQNIVSIDYNGFLEEWMVFTLRIIQSWIYVFLSWQIFRKKGSELADESRNALKIYNWLKVFLTLKTVYYILLPLIYIGVYLIGKNNFFSNYQREIVFLITSLIFFILSIYLLLRPKLFITVLQHMPTEVKEPVLDISIIKTSINDSKIYKDANLTLADLADALNVKAQDITEAINTSSHNNFRDFINTIRINNMIAEVNKEAYEKKSITGLSKEYGFKSESTFFRVFKSRLKVTPQQFFTQKFSKK